MRLLEHVEKILKLVNAPLVNLDNYYVSRGVRFYQVIIDKYTHIIIMADTTNAGLFSPSNVRKVESKKGSIRE